MSITSEVVSTAGARLKERASACLMNTYGDRDITIVRGEGAYAWDADGNRYIDFLAGIAVNNLGHCHPAIVETIKTQAAKLMHTSNIHLNEPSIELAEILCRETGMDKAFICNTGAETAETAIKLARLWSVRNHPRPKETVMVFTGGFHGRTYGALSATHNPKFREGFGALVPGFRFAEYNSLESVDANWDDSVCAVLYEPIQGNSGVATATKEFQQGLRQRCTDRGAAFIPDEVQCGMGRTGRSFAYMYAGVEPDILTIAKALGGGFPIGAVLGKGAFAEAFTKGSHGTTFGGNPLACAVAITVCKYLFDPKMHAEVSRLGDRLEGRLKGIMKNHPDLTDHIRGIGLMRGLVMRRECLSIPKIAARHGLLVTGAGNEVVRLIPPLILTDDQVDEGADRLSAAVDEFASNLS